jgi:hypothetical protein
MLGMLGCGSSNEHLRRNGVVAPATVMSLEDTCWRIDAKPVFRIDLRIEPEKGPPFDAVAVQALPLHQIGQVQPGAPVTVHFDPKRPGNAVVMGVDRARLIRLCLGSATCDDLEERAAVCSTRGRKPA